MIFKAIMAGIAIAIGCIVNITIGGIEGAFLFSCGLLTVLYFNLNLFTGKAGLLVGKKISILQLVQILLGNVIGGMLTAGIYILAQNQSGIDACISIAQKRTSLEPIAGLVLSFFCGILMYIAVTGFKKTKSPVIVIIPVMLFIMSGFQHSIADVFYYIVGYNGHFWLCFAYWLITVVGNILGCCFIPFIGCCISIENNIRKYLKNK